MNRIYHLVDDALSLALIPTATAAVLAPEPAGESNSSHCIFTPLHYERNYAYPLIVWLHGPDDDEHQVARIMPLVSMRNYVAVGPRGTLRSPRAEAGFRWSQNERQIVLAEQGVLSAIAAARRWLNIAPARIYLAGFACGGTMALRIALNQPDAFAGVLSIGGAFPTTSRPLGQLHAARRLKVFLASGRDSRCYPEAQVCDNLRLLHSAGMSVNLRLYPCADDLTTNMLSDMDRWVMEQIAALQPAEHDVPSPRSGGK
jgi:phospholipase/carboxylesterase